MAHRLGPGCWPLRNARRVPEWWPLRGMTSSMSTSAAERFTCLQCRVKPASIDRRGLDRAALESARHSGIEMRDCGEDRHAAKRA